MLFGANAEIAQVVTMAVKDNTSKPVIVKLTPNVGSLNIAGIAKAVEVGGADVVSLVNTFAAMDLELSPKGAKEVLGNGTGGLSGPAIRTEALEMVQRVYKAVKIPIIGMGGISTGADALRFIHGGATAVAIGTANFAKPYSIPDAIFEIAKYVKDWKTVRDLVGQRIGTER